MTTAQQVTLGIIIALGASIALALLWGKFAKVGRGPDTKQDAADQLDALIAAQPAKEDAWIADLESAIEIQTANLAILRRAPFTVENIQTCGQAVVSIEGAQRVLKLLYERRGYGKRESMATLTEGRM